MIDNDDMEDLYQEFYINKKDNRILKTFSLDDRRMFLKEEAKNSKNLFEIMRENTSLIKCFLCGDEEMSVSCLNKCEICPRKVCSRCLEKCSKCDMDCCRGCCSTREYKKGRLLTCNNCIFVN